MKIRIQKWGSSLALRIPKSFADKAGLEDDAPVEISLVDGKPVVAPIIGPILILEYLLAQVTEDNLHREVDTGQAMGKEAW